MEIAQLQQIGLSQTEAKLYLALIKLGSSDVQQLIEETGFYKPNTYDALERMCEKGIISKIIEGRKRIYQLQNPNSLLEYIEKKKESLKEEENIARELVKEAKESKEQNTISETAIVMKGIQGVKQIYREIIEEKKDYFVFGSPNESSSLIGEYYWQNIHQKQREFGIKAKMIFHKSLRNWNEIIPKDIIELKFLNEEMEPLTETTIYGTKVAFVVWTEKPSVTIINNENVAKTYKQIFEILWRISKE